MDRYQKQNITYRKLLQMLKQDQQLNDWERGFMDSLLNKDDLRLSDKQKDKLLSMVDKSWIGMYYKVLLREYVRGYKR